MRLNHGNVGQTLVAPTRRVQLGQLLHRQRRLIDAAAGELIALHARREVLEHEDELAGFEVDVREVAGRGADVHRVRHVAVEAHLGLIGAQRQPGGAAGRIGGGELAHDRPRRSLLGAIVVQRVAHARPHLSGADRLCAKALDAGALEHAGAAEDLGEPLRRDGVGMAN